MDSGACAGPGQALLHAVLQGAGETTVQQWARPALHTSCPHLHVGSGKGRRWAGSLKGIGTVRFRTKPGPSTCRTKFALNKMCVGGEHRKGCFSFVPLKRDYGLTDQVSSVICEQKLVLWKRECG